MKEKRHYTNKERRRIYAAPKVKLKKKPVVPIQKDKDTIKERRKIISSHMKQLGERYFCPELGEDVFILKKSIKETSEHAAKDAKGTLLAINIDILIGNAAKIRELKPNSRNQNEFRKMHLLMCLVKNVGYAKIIVGELYAPRTIGGKFVHYCVTHVSLKEIKK